MFNTDYQIFIHKSRYARWREDDKRREDWPETVTRYMDYMTGQAMSHGYSLDENTYHLLSEAILNLDIMPSMRSLMTAGVALERDHVAGYNCSYLPIDNVRSFDEMMYILMCGTGVGFSVEAKYTDRLPIISEEIHDTDTAISVSDSKIGWAKSYRELLSLLYAGQVPRWDTSKVRPSGARLRTFGGRASGPEPLEDLFRFTVEIFRAAAGRRLRPLEVHDLCCKVADIVVVGGVRRSALISLSDLNDSDMRSSKFGSWWEGDGQRRLANNSAVYRCTPSMSSFLSEWRMLYESKSGERGIFNREACVNKITEEGRRDPDYDWGTNPCSEIILRPYQFCNLSECVVRPTDFLADLNRKVELATILGTLQSTMTEFRYLRKVWKDNCEEERLLGVSLTGIMDHPVLNGSSSWGKFSTGEEWSQEVSLEETLTQLKETAVETNKEWADNLGINQSASVTCVKPSGTVSQLVDSSSGIHGRFSPFYIRRVRNDFKDPITQFLIDQGVPYEVDKTSSNTCIFSFPIKSPESSIMAKEQDAINQLEIWKLYQDFWCEHKPSCTVYYKEEEFLGVGDWVYRNFDKISGVSFLPYDDHVYEQAPYEPIGEEEYEAAREAMPRVIDWSKLKEYENEDNTTGMQELACKGGACEI